MQKAMSTDAAAATMLVLNKLSSPCPLSPAVITQPAARAHHQPMQRGSHSNRIIFYQTVIKSQAKSFISTLFPLKPRINHGPALLRKLTIWNHDSLIR
jgi:hypothetical protein